MMGRFEKHQFGMETDGVTSDRELIHLWQNGGPREKISHILYSRYHGQVKALFRSLRMAIEVDDLSQETFFDAFRGLDKFRAEASFRNWLFQIARNNALKALRYRRSLKRSAARLVSLAEFLESLDEADQGPECPAGDSPLARTLAGEDRVRLGRAVGLLPDRDQVMVSFRIVQGLSVQQTATAMKMPEGTVKSRWARIRAALRRELSPHFADLTPRGESQR